jgi:hypothetical protein
MVLGLLVLTLSSTNLKILELPDAIRITRHTVGPVDHEHSPTCFEAVSVTRMFPCLVSPLAIPIGLDISRL